jgi:hypothetical protein
MQGISESYQRTRQHLELLAMEAEADKQGESLVPDDEHYTVASEYEELLCLERQDLEELVNSYEQMQLENTTSQDKGAPH